MGTGFAQPKTIGNLSVISKKGNIMEPIGSKCAKGFRVNLPAFRGVVSPHFSAIQPWAYSCNTTENNSKATSNASVDI